MVCNREKRGGLVVECFNDFGSYKVGSPIYWYTTSITGAKSKPKILARKIFVVCPIGKDPVKRKINI